MLSMTEAVPWAPVAFAQSQEVLVSLYRPCSAAPGGRYGDSGFKEYHQARRAGQAGPWAGYLAIAIPDRVPLPDMLRGEEGAQAAICDANYALSRALANGLPQEQFSEAQGINRAQAPPASVYVFSGRIPLPFYRDHVRTILPERRQP